MALNKMESHKMSDFPLPFSFNPSEWIKGKFYFGANVSLTPFQRILTSFLTDRIGLRFSAFST